MVKPFKISIVTAARSEYGLLRWLMKDFDDDPNFELQLIVTGSHLSPFFGNTYLEIESDGFLIAEKVDMKLSTESTKNIAYSMGLCGVGFAEVFAKLKPQLAIVLGDRYELLPICSAALIMGIPIAHISGGDVTEGAIDNQIRNAVSQMAQLHFPGTEESAKRLAQMGIKPENIFSVGEPGLDNFLRLKHLDRNALADKFNLDPEKEWILMTYHPETLASLEQNLKVVESIVKALLTLNGFQVIITKANADFGGVQINNFLSQVALSSPERFRFFDGLGQLGYINMMKQVCCLIGNSSSGVVEAPMLGKPVINVGNRQKGRYMGANIIQSSGETAELIEQLDSLTRNKQRPTFSSDNYYGDGCTSHRIYTILKERFLNTKNGSR